MAKEKKELKDIDEIKQELIENTEGIIEELSTVDSIIQEIVIEETEPEQEEVQQKCSDCVRFEVYGATYRRKGYKTCSGMYKANDMLAFGKYGKLAPFLVKENLVPDIFPKCKYFKNKLDK
jgi:hypothetical protein